VHLSGAVVPNILGCIILAKSWTGTCCVLFI
jgi:hypothetical protein